MFQKLGLVAAMSSRASESALQCLVEELKLEAGTKRIRSLTGSHRASSVLHTECLQGCPAAWHSSWKHSLLGTQILCFTVKNSRKKFAELQPGPKKTVQQPNHFLCCMVLESTEIVFLKPHHQIY